MEQKNQIEQRVRDSFARHGGIQPDYCQWCGEALTEHEKALHLEACEKCEPVEAAA